MHIISNVQTRRWAHNKNAMRLIPRKAFSSIEYRMDNT